VARPLSAALRPLLRSSLRRVPPVRAAWTRLARRRELEFWRRATAAGRFAGESREPFFTEHVGLERAFYDGKRILDLGCGPRGDLDWADGAVERVGLDPLADEYRELIGGEGGMRMVAGAGERMPFAADSFDVVVSLNALDHVGDLGRVIAEVKRVLVPGGTLILITDVGHRARITEPQTFGWEVVGLFAPELQPRLVRRLRDTGAGIDQSVRDGIELAPADRGPGVLVARLEGRPLSPGDSSR
jgi:SAM-dependent methyltransferase